MGTAWQLLAALVAIAPLSGAAAILGDSHVATADAPHLVDAVATGLLESAIPFLLSNVAIRELQISTGVLILNLGPVMGVGLAVLSLGDHLISAGDEATRPGSRAPSDAAQACRQLARAWRCSLRSFTSPRMRKAHVAGSLPRASCVTRGRQPHANRPGCAIASSTG